jgi:hypothetical protein
MKAYGLAGIVLLAVAELGMLRQIEPFYTWFYCFAWWSYILVADNVVLKLRGRSLLSSRRRELASMLPLSVFLWLAFEGYNLVIRNWAYAGVPAQLWLRWPGYAIAFATVLPGIFITSDLIQWLFGSGRSSASSERESLDHAPESAASRTFVAIGAILTIAPLLWPRVFFPAVWIGPIFLLDPLLEKLGVRSLSLSIAAGDRSRAWSLMGGGLLCGGIWEFWNFWAASKWVYTVPYFQNWKIFEMPVLGFLGFPPFALECWIVYHLLSSVLHRLPSTATRTVFWTAIGLFCILMFRGIDTHTVLNFTEAHLRSIGPWAPGFF